MKDENTSEKINMKVGSFSWMNDDHYLLTLLINDSTILGTKTTTCDYKSIPHPLKKKKKSK